MSLKRGGQGKGRTREGEDTGRGGQGKGKTGEGRRFVFIDTPRRVTPLTVKYCLSGEITA